MVAEPTVAAGRSAAESEALLEVSNLVKHFPVRRALRRVGEIRAVDDISFSVSRGRTLGLVGESGSGKSTAARLVLRLLAPDSGRIRFDGIDLLTVNRAELKALRKRMQIIFQDPLGSLNPRMTALEIIGEPLEVHRIATGKAMQRRVEELLETVGLSGADRSKYAHQFSGGQAQRIGIARALATEPDLIICDEAVSALDVSVQAQVLNLLRRLQRELGLAYVFIAHDLNVVRYMSDEICVMYLGEIVERGDSDTLFAHPQHPYTETLLAAIPTPDPVEARMANRAVAEGEPPSPSNPPAGCRFHTRCPYVFHRCTTEAPEMWEVAGQQAACHRHDRAGEGANP
jgi:oligopeptide/dipeptide ABC transporter ATP-binding protein